MICVSVWCVKEGMKKMRFANYKLTDLSKICFYDGLRVHHLRQV